MTMRILLLLSSLFLFGCATGPNYYDAPKPAADDRKATIYVLRNPGDSNIEAA